MSILERDHAVCKKGYVVDPLLMSMLLLLLLLLLQRL